MSPHCSGRGRGAGGNPGDSSIHPEQGKGRGGEEQGGGSGGEGTISELEKEE